MVLPAEQQLDFWPDSLDDQIHVKASNDGDYSLKCFIRWRGPTGSSSSYSSFPPVTVAPGAQTSFPFNVVYIDRGLSLAPNGKFPCRDYSTARGRDLIDYLVADLREWLGLKRFSHQKYWAAMDVILSNLLDAHQRKGQLLVGRNTAKRIYRYRNPQGVSDDILRVITDHLARRDYIALQSGKSNEYQGNASWCVPLLPLIAEYEKCEARVLLHERAELAELRERPKKVGKRKIKGEQITPSERERKRLEVLAAPVRTYTRTWIDHTATLDGDYLSPWVRRVFTVNTNLGGRIYGAFQNIPAVDRGRILIDGERTVELDFKAIHFNILYAEEGLPFMGEPYQAEGYSREAVKAVCLHLANTDNLAGLKACITKSGNPEVRQTQRDHEAAMDAYKLIRSLGLKADKPAEPPQLEGFIQGIPAGTIGEDLLNAILKTHSAIAHRFGGDDIGLRLQRKDSDIITAAIDRLQDVPVLPVHDSIRCKVSDAGLVEEAMTRACVGVIGQPIKIERK